MHTDNAIIIAAPPDVVYRLASRVEEWPRLLPHYRRVVVRADSGQERLVEMAATRDGWPVWWLSVQMLDPVQQRIHYRHVRGITRGMIVTWTMAPHAGGVEVRIIHDFNPPWPTPLGAFVAQHIVGAQFVRVIADRTLRHIKRVAEASAAAGERPSDAAGERSSDEDPVSALGVAGTVAEGQSVGARMRRRCAPWRRLRPSGQGAL